MTKYRGGVLTGEHIRYLAEVFRNVCGDFAASCGGAPLSIIKQYVEQQRTPGG